MHFYMRILLINFFVIALFSTQGMTDTSSIQMHRIITEQPQCSASVCMSMQISGTIQSYAVEEKLAKNLIPKNLTEGGQWDSIHNAIKWGPFQDQIVRKFSYVIFGNLVSNHTFSGIVRLPYSQINRTISPNNDCSAQINIQISPASSVYIYGIEECLSQNLIPSNISDNGVVWDQAHQSVKWGPFEDNHSRVLSYELFGLLGEYDINGIVSFDGHNASINGNDKLSLILKPMDIFLSVWMRQYM